MGIFIVNSIVWILAIYGLIEIIKNIIYIFACTKFKSNGIYFIIAVKNQENKIEVFLRTIIFKLIYGKEDFLNNIIITDLDSKDDTLKIIDKLSKEYDILKNMSWKECKQLVENLKEN